MNDFKFAFRQWLKHPGSTAMAVLILALGIGGTTAVFTVANRVLLNPIPGRDSQRLFTVREVNAMSGFRWRVSPPLFQELGSYTNLIESLTYFGSEEKKIQVNEKTVKIYGAKVAPNFFELLGIRPLAGRTFLSREEAEETGNVIVISHGLWQQHFGGDPDLIGHTLKLDGKDHTVVGLLASNIQFPGQSQFWIPYVIPAEELNSSWEPEEGTWTVLGRLRKVGGMKELRTILDSVAARWQRNIGKPNQRWAFQANPARQDFIDPVLEKTLWTLQGMVGALLLIACANVGNLLFSRALARRGEFGIRMAMGAGGWRIARQLLVESLSLAGLAAAFGVSVAWGGIIALEQFYLNPLARSNLMGVDWRVVGTTCLVSAVAGVFFGVAPAWLAARVKVSDSLKESAPQHSGGLLQRMFHDGFVVIQVSLAVVLLTGAGMMIHSVVKLLRVDPGFNPKGLYSVLYDVAAMMNSRDDFEAALRRGLSPGGARAEATPAKTRRLWNWQELMLERLHAIPGIEAAAVDDHPGGGYSCRVEGRTDPVQVGKGDISVRIGDYFRTVGVPLVAGRLLTNEDAAAGQQTVVINERLARECWPGQNPLGKKIRPIVLPHDNEPERIVVGIVKDLKDRWRDAEVKPAFYEPGERNRNQFPHMGQYVIRSKLNLDVLRESLMRLGQEMSPAVEVRNYYSVEAQLYSSTAPRRVMMWLLTTMGGLGLLMSALGVYAVMACTVVRRTKEVGIRMAMGAGRTQVRDLFFRHGARLIVNGMLLGMVVAITLGHCLESLLFGVTPSDPWAFAGILLVLGIAGGVACWIPARRATKVDPIVALRHE